MLLKYLEIIVLRASRTGAGHSVVYTTDCTPTAPPSPPPPAVHVRLTPSEDIIGTSSNIFSLNIYVFIQRWNC